METPVDVRPGLVASALRRRWRLIGLASLLGMLIAFGAYTMQPTSYTSTAAVFLNPLEGNPYSPTTSTARNDQLASLETEAALVTTDRVVEVARDLDSLPEAAASHVDVTVPSNSQVLRISYQASSPASAQRGAAAFADAYLAHRQAKAEEAGKSQADRLDTQAAATSAELDAATQRLTAAAPDSAAELLGQQQVQVYASQLAQLRIELSRITSASTNPGEVITPAGLPSTPNGLPLPVLIVGGLMVGLLLGVIVATAREHSDDHIIGGQDITPLGLPHVSELPGGVVEDTKEAAEAVRVLRGFVLSSAPRRSFSVGILAATANDDSASAVALALSRSLARAGRRVVLLIANGSGRTPLTNADSSGLSELVRADAAAAAALLPSTLSFVEPNLSVIGPGLRHEDDADLFETENAVHLLDELRKRQDVVVVAAPPAPTATGLALATTVDLVSVTASVGRTRLTDLLTALDELGQRKVRVLVISLVRQSAWRVSSLMGGRARRLTSTDKTGTNGSRPGGLQARQPNGQLEESTSDMDESRSAPRAMDLEVALTELGRRGIDVVRVPSSSTENGQQANDRDVASHDDGGSKRHGTSL